MTPSPPERGRGNSAVWFHRCAPVSDLGWSAAGRPAQGGKLTLGETEIDVLKSHYGSVAGPVRLAYFFQNDGEHGGQPSLSAGSRIDRIAQILQRLLRDGPVNAESYDAIRPHKEYV